MMNPGLRRISGLLIICLFLAAFGYFHLFRYVYKNEDTSKDGATIKLQKAKDGAIKDDHDTASAMGGDGQLSNAQAAAMKREIQELAGRINQLEADMKDNSNAGVVVVNSGDNAKGKQEKVLKEPEMKLEPEKDKQPDKLNEGLKSSNDEKNTLEKKSPPNTLELNDNRFAERRKQIIESCKALNLTSDTKGDELGPPRCEVGEKHMFVYCAIPKSGCWFWGRILKIIEYEKKFSSLNEMRMSNSYIKPLIQLKKFLSNHTQTEVEAFKSKSVKFLFVREPYSRLFSAYNDKILSPNPLFWNMGKKIVAATRHNPSNESLKYGHDVTFAEYIKYLLLQFESGKSLDPHFAPMNTICDPCRFNFDYFGKLETFASDAEFIIEKLKEKNNNISVNFADFDKETAIDRVNGLIDYLFAKLKETKGLKYPTYNFYLRFWRDLMIAGHLSKDLDMPILKSEQNLTLSKHEFLNLVKYALSRPMNQTLVKKQRNEALLQAYGSVPKEDLERLSKFVKKDCILFGYDERPRHIFDQPTKPHQDTFNYFDAI